MTPSAQPNPLDVRGLPPPQPMVKILEAVTWLAPGETLTVIHNRVPHLLYPRLRERGLLVETSESPDGTVTLAIQRPLK
ncbi:MAG: DUF2249 domain-containing protein [Nitrospirae bacterium]|nr:DUF2249 domain-containing protein [Magnetococcales bacterium]HAT51016.1 hypothetical protein [Alphaproteobacteria bacterium]